MHDVKKFSKLRYLYDKYKWQNRVRKCEKRKNRFGLQEFPLKSVYFIACKNKGELMQET